jgi:hypothetical protein
LSKAGYTVYAIGKRKGTIGTIEITEQWPANVEPDLISLYLNPKNQIEYTQRILQSGSKKVVFNPGSENPDLSAKLKQAGIEFEEACTLVMLSIGAL